ncbi:MAG TPA: YlbF family regulator [Clostridia bacterium]|nr:YlbF family regulator [Clostridia bacterium]
MNVLEKARELGEALAESEQLKRLNNAQTALENDDRGMGLMEDYRLLQIELVKATRDDNNEVKIGDIKDMLMSKQAEIDDYKITSEYIEAKNDFDELMKNVNDVITFAITGEACSPSKCASCGGGCGGAHA